MVGKGRFGILAVRSPDPVLSLLAPLGLAASAGTALLVDLVGGPPVDRGRTLADLAADGPRLAELSPGRSGVAVLAGGPITCQASVEPIEHLASRWPAIVVRVAGEEWPGPTVPARPLYPGWLAPTGADAAVWQPMGAGSRPPGPGPVLPRLRASTISQLLNGRLPRRSRWIGAWERVWGLPWA